jgi:hypothetical protein
MSQFPEGGDWFGKVDYGSASGASFTFNFSNVVSPIATAGCSNGETVVILFCLRGGVSHFFFADEDGGSRRLNQAQFVGSHDLSSPRLVAARADP